MKESSLWPPGKCSNAYILSSCENEWNMLSLELMMEERVYIAFAWICIKNICKDTEKKQVTVHLFVVGVELG